MNLLWRKIINATAILIALFAIGCLVKIIPLNINEYEVPLLVIIGAIPLINVSVSSKKGLVRPGRYTSDPSTFVDRNSQIDTILEATHSGRNIINVFGITGIGVTRLQQFTADLINRRLPYKYRKKHCKRPIRVLGSRYRSYYLNASSITNLHDILSIIKEVILLEGSSVTSVPTLCETIKQTLKHKKLVLFFDGIYNREQMILIEEFASQYFPLRDKDTFVLGTHHKSLSYQHNYGYVEILQFNKNDLMILAKAHNVELDEKTSIQFYEITEGIPMFAYLLLKDNSILEISNSERIRDIYAYLKQFVVPSMSGEECNVLERIALLSLSNPIISEKDLQMLGLDSGDQILCSLYDKGLIQFSIIRKEVCIQRAIAKAFLSYTLTQENICTKLYQHYKIIDKSHFAILYLLVSKNNTAIDEQYIKNHLTAWIKNHDILSLLLALSPSVELSVNIKEKYPRLYVLYIYACAYAFSSSGDYPRAENLLNQLIIDGVIIKRYDSELNEWDFALHFLWADIEHLLNKYTVAIEILECLIINCQAFDNSTRLPQLYWMKAHCLRHQAKNLYESLRVYEECRNLAITYNQSEYLIRSLHGQICIALINDNATYNFIEAFSLLNDVYLSEPECWNRYKYNTRKYESIYYRLYHNDKDTSLTLLSESLEGYTSIRKRNIYDVSFEFGEYYRFWKEYEKSRESYTKCVEFAKMNLDYNLESLALIGLFLLDMATGKSFDPAHIIKIQSRALEKELYLTVKYAQQIQESIKNGLSDFTINLFNP